jgi:3-oxoacyl-[acyl-carrier-protein] synthase III
MFLAGFGKYLPSLELSNEDFSYLLLTSDEWIRTRTGILKAVSSKIGIPMESFWTNLERYGNTSAASIPIAMTELQEQGGLEGQAAWVLSLACGSGLTWGAALLRS